MNQLFPAFPMTPDAFGNLPSVSIVVPNNNNNMHNGTILRGNAWLQDNLERMQNGPKTTTAC